MCEKITEVFLVLGVGWMMGRVLAQPVLPFLPGGAAEIVPGVGLVTGVQLGF